MNKQLRDDPVILLGMHHSGTSILARILHENGVHMQANMRHHESKFFALQLHDSLVLQGGDGWARVPIMPVEEVMHWKNEIQRLIAKKGLRKYRDAGYDGVSRWGFKDPRTCIMTPMYLKIFPNAHLVHIVRSADDVATSLAENVKRGVGNIPDREHWKALWREYVGRVREFGPKHKNYYEMAYQDFCFEPVEEIKKLFAWLNVEFTEKTETFLRENIYTHRVNISEQ